MFKKISLFFIFYLIIPSNFTLSISSFSLLPSFVINKSSSLYSLALKKKSAIKNTSTKDFELERLKQKLKKENDKIKLTEKNKKPVSKFKSYYKTYSEKLKEKEKRKIRGFWLSPWYNFVWTLGALGFTVGLHSATAHLTASAFSSSNDKYSYHYGATSGSNSFRSGIISVSPFISLKLSQTIFGISLLYGNFHPAVSLALLRLTWFSMYHFSALTFYNALGARGDLTAFADKSGFNFAVLSVLAFFDWFINVVWLSDLYTKSYERSIYKSKDKKKLSYFYHFDFKNIQAGFSYAF